MSEYWKSTPKYWCKHCSTYVKDTKFERSQHEATGKHQGNLKRFLRGVHQEHEKEEREKQRAKAEIDRLKGIVSGPRQITSDATTLNASSAKIGVASSKPTVADRKKQMAQLAEMGITVPDEFRRELAMAGTWEAIPGTTGNETQSSPIDALSVGIRKRKVEQIEDEEPVEEPSTARKGWGIKTRVYPGGSSLSDPDLDVLLAGGKLPKKEDTSADVMPNEVLDRTVAEVPGYLSDDKSVIEKAIEASEDAGIGTPRAVSSSEPVPGVVFKKRKPKFAKHG